MSAKCQKQIIAANPHADAYRLVAFRGRTIRVFILRRCIDISAGRRIGIVAVRGWSVGVIALRGVSIRGGRQIVAICWRVVPIRDWIPISPVITSPPVRPRRPDRLYCLFLALNGESPWQAPCQSRREQQSLRYWTTRSASI
jgi:hypothetical protein